MNIIAPKPAGRVCTAESSVEDSEHRYPVLKCFLVLRLAHKHTRSQKILIELVCSQSLHLPQARLRGLAVVHEQPCRRPEEGLALVVQPRVRGSETGVTHEQEAPGRRPQDSVSFVFARRGGKRGQANSVSDAGFQVHGGAPENIAHPGASKSSAHKSVDMP